MSTLRVIPESPKSQRKRYEEATKRRWENVSFEKLDPFATALGALRIERTLALLEKHLSFEGCSIADLGCGVARLGALLADRGAQLTAVDISAKITDYIKHPNIQYRTACIPYIPIADCLFDGLIFADVIAEIDIQLHRLTLSELARLLKRDGWMVCSSALDLYSWDAYEQFAQLISSEFDIIAEVKSYHRLHFYLTRLIKAPSRFARAGSDREYREKQLQKRAGFCRLWFRTSSNKRIFGVWKPIAQLLMPLCSSFERNKSLVRTLERLSKLLWRGSACTHVILLVRKKKI